MISLTDSTSISDLEQRLTLAIKETVERTVNSDTTAKVDRVGVFAKTGIETKPGRKHMIEFRFTIELDVQP